MNRIHLMLASAALAVPASIAAQTTAPTPAATAKPAVGATVYDQSGAMVGTIASMTASAVTIDTGTHKVPVPPTSVGTNAKGVVMAMTKAQLDAAYEQASAQAGAQLKAKLVPGTPVNSLHGAATIGTIKMADDQFVTVTTAKGDVKLPVNGFSTDAQGRVIVGLTADQFNAAVGGSAAPATPAPSSN